MPILRLEQIGTVNSPVKEPVDRRWGDVVSEIKISERFAAGLAGIEQFSHVLVVFLMHHVAFDPKTDLVRKPQGREDMPSIGIFAQRSRHRPSRVGVSAVELVAVEQNSLRVKGLDAIDGTPVLDVKPYFPMFDRVESPRLPEWVRRLMEGYF